MRLQTRLILLIGGLLFLIILALTFSFERLLVSTLEKNIGASALKLAKTVAAPSASAVTRPPGETPRTESGELDQRHALVTFRVLPSANVAVAVNCVRSPTLASMKLPLIAMAVG